MHNKVVEILNSKVSGCNAVLTSPGEGEAGDSWVSVSADHILNVCETLKTCELEFNVLQVISGTDYPEYIDVTYVLASFTKGHQLLLKAKLDKPSSDFVPTIDSVDSVWKAANWQERECADMLGITFTNHPDPRRILCPDDWEGYPLRKDYVVQEIYNGMTVNPEAKMNIPDREFADKQKAAEKAAKEKADQ